MKKFVNLCSLPLVILASCARAPSGSETQGHFENATAQDLQAYEGRLAFVPEYEPGQNVMVSSEIFELQGYTMLKAIVDAGVRTIYLIPSYRQSEAPADAMATLRVGAERVLQDRGIEITPSVSKDLDAIFAHVKIVPRLEPIYARAEQEVYPTVWTRDWAPLTARTSDGAFRIMDLNYYPERIWDDVVPASLLALLKPERSNLDRVSLPVYNEGGNFMNTPEWCFMTTRVSEANSAESASITEADEVASNRRVTRDMVLSNAEITSYYNKYGCKQTHIFDRLPGEGTGHIDMWSKLLDSHTVLVGDLWDETISSLTEENFASLSKGHRSLESMVASLRKTQAFLRTQQQWFSEHGFQVVKAPMPLNLWLFDDVYFKARQQMLIDGGMSPDEARRRAESESGGGLTRSYTNSLVANRTVITPRYKKGHTTSWNPITREQKTVRFEYPDAALLPRYEATMKQATEALGYQIDFIETDELISIGGSVHCTTMQTPL